MFTLSMLWLKGLLLRRGGRLAGAMLGVAMTVALIASLLGFTDGASRSMTERAVESVPVDWQVQLATGAAPEAIIQAIQQATPTSVVLPTAYAEVASFSSSTDGTVQTTGAGKALGLPLGYDVALGGQIRSLLGATSGALFAQQTAANLHVTIGDSVTLERLGLPPVTITVAGIVDLPNQDSMFQAVGLPPGAAPQAPPDHIVLLPDSQWHTLFDPQAAIRPDSVRAQLHVKLDRASLPRDPSLAYIDVLGRAKNLEARIAGSGIVANNLAARLDATRKDSLYARVLFLFLGSPGIAIATLLTLAVASAGLVRRRREQALLRVRGASMRHLMTLAGLEAAGIGFAGVVLGLLIAVLVSPGAAQAGPVILATVAGLALSLAAVLVPAWRSARQGTVAAARLLVGRAAHPLWQKLWLDLALLAIGGLVFWYGATSSYKVVLAPEGVAATAVDYTAFLAPVCLWLGAGLLVMRLLSALAGNAKAFWNRALGGLGGDLSPLVASALARRRRSLGRAGALTALAVGFAVSTAVFNTTYNAQGRVDAQLTNGADVTVTGTSANPAGARLAALKAVPGVAAAEPMQHRFAYVGADLQDLYGIDPATVGRATSLSNAFFANGDAAGTMAALAATPDGVLVSEETVVDFQLQPGDTLNLRLQNATDHQYHVIPFKFVGIAREFPTAPHDSFLVANAAFVANATGAAGSEVVLIKTAGDPDVLSTSIKPLVADLPGARVTSINEAQHLIASSLTAVDLKGLTNLELTFAILSVLGVAGLLFGLDIAERKRGFAILALLGARAREISGFLWSEAIVVVGTGLVAGGLIGLGIAYVLVKELDGVFDPPPETLAMPWPYLAALVLAGIASVSLVVLLASRTLQVPKVEALREV